MKVISKDEAAALIKDGDFVACAGFVGAPARSNALGRAMMIRAVARMEIPRLRFIRRESCSQYVETIHFQNEGVETRSKFNFFADLAAKQCVHRDAKSHQSVYLAVHLETGFGACRTARGPALLRLRNAVER